MEGNIALKQKYAGVGYFWQTSVSSFPKWFCSDRRVWAWPGSWASGGNPARHPAWGSGQRPALVYLQTWAPSPSEGGGSRGTQAVLWGSLSSPQEPGVRVEKGCAWQRPHAGPGDPLGTACIFF
uniref:Uncharacterized protein n=1 Tax=Molossus molossus TaxID=27622 RepID=A0A7J8BKC7_MOLMO|nr:hypothetical protein HJG59_010179 [Molossus molossus]